LENRAQTGDLRRSVTALSLQAERLKRILTISQTLASTFNIEEVLELILAAATELTDTEAASILLLDDYGSELHFAATSSRDREQLMPLRVPVVGSLAGSILTAGKPMVIEDVQSDPRHYTGIDKKLAFQSRSLLGVPLLIRDKPIGVLEAVNKVGGERFSEDDGQLLMTLAAQAAVAIENAQLVTALQKAYRQLNEVDQLKSDFIAIASHELRTPLGLILGYAAMLKEDANPETGEQLDVVLHAALRLRGLIDDMVNLQQIGEHNAKLDVEEFSLQDLILSAIQSARDLYTTKEQTVSADSPTPPIKLTADRSKILLVLNNLLNNAIKFTPPHGHIAITSEIIGHEAQVHVADTGAGIPVADQQKIFERFYQVEPHLTRKHGGLGLGLAIAKGMIDLHDGRIWLESVQGYGSRFSFAIPIGKLK
jgi:signal transduction histidine kinase